ncbi:hypothetical protein, partial [Paracoccus yeei]|uniref:hypothetical protein n=2 Tax=Paracoccus yeei TaxID=147645 RepID=UPI001CD4CC4A
TKSQMKRHSLDAPPGQSFPDCLGSAPASPPLPAFPPSGEAVFRKWRRGLQAEKSPDPKKPDI